MVIVYLIVNSVDICNGTMDLKKKHRFKHKRYLYKKITVTVNVVTEKCERDSVTRVSHNLTHLDPMFTFLSIFEYGFDFAAVFVSKVQNWP